MKEGTCRQQILHAISNITARSGQPTFRVIDVVEELRRQGSPFAESSIRTHVVSAMCVNAPANHPIRYPDLFRVGRGTYELYDPQRHGEVMVSTPRGGIGSRSRRSDGTKARLTELSDRFEDYLRVFEQAVPFTRQGQWELHYKTITLRRQLGSVALAVESHEFRNSLRQTLRRWGIGIRGSRQVPESVFEDGLRAFLRPLQALEHEQIEAPTIEVRHLTERVWTLIRDMPVVESVAKIVAGSKTLHHLLPDLVPPMDRAWTGEFFRWSLVDPQKNQERIFKEAFAGFCSVAKVTRPSRFVGAGWHTSQSKVLDNALIGYLKAQTPTVT